MLLRRRNSKDFMALMHLLRRFIMGVTASHRRNNHSLPTDTTHRNPSLSHNFRGRVTDRPLRHLSTRAQVSPVPFKVGIQLQ